MTGPAELVALRAWFDAFTAGYLAGGGGVPALKREHSLRVFEECRLLVQAEGFGPRLALLCHAAALVHDIGRFPQYEKYATLRDARSVDHGALGAATLTRRRALAGFAPDLARDILYAVALHNRRALPPKDQGDATTAVKILRDADKLDIVRVMLGHFPMDASDREAAFFGLTDDPDGISRGMVEAILARRMGAHAHMRTINDFYLLLLSWTYDFNYPSTRRFFLERGYVSEIAAALPPLESVDILCRQVAGDLTKGAAFAHEDAKGRPMPPTPESRP